MDHTNNYYSAITISVLIFLFQDSQKWKRRHEEPAVVLLVG